MRYMVIQFDLARTKQKCFKIKKMCRMFYAGIKKIEHDISPHGYY